MFGNGNLDGLMDDYATDAVLITADETYRGDDEIREMFVSLLSEFDDPSVEFTLTKQVVEGEFAYIIWNAETPANHYEFASDTFVVRDDEIVAQTFAAKVSPK
ncbi:nuclear transport factor 2 family protein [Halomarina rubra]|uniref:Nuclear transport factor 2 family protein n=1 Tax=Halomarina rubra TaxID=2071873 RepID=A0ABD6AUH0_9EURY